VFTILRVLEKENAELKKHIEELEQILGMNSKDSSKPLSSGLQGIYLVQPKRRHKNMKQKKAASFINRHF